MYKELLDQIVQYHSSNTPYNEFNNMIFPYKGDQPLLIINNKIFQICIYEFGFKSENFRSGRSKFKRFKEINTFIDSLNPLTNELTIHQNDGYTCLYCYLGTHNILNYSYMICDRCLKKTGEIQSGFVISQIPIKFKYNDITYSYRNLKFIWYTIDKTSLNFWYNYNTNNERIQLEYCSNLTELPTSLYITYDYPIKGYHKCKICKEDCGNEELEDGTFDEEEFERERNDENVMCDDCRQIFRYRYINKLRLEIIPVIMYLNCMDFSVPEIRSYIKQFLF
jgi:hypothetical protein